MKKVFPFFILIVLAFTLKAQNPIFTLINYSGSYSITCFNYSINMVASDTSFAPLTYSWTNGTAVLSGSNVLIAAPGLYTVTAFGTGSTSSSQTFAVVTDTAVPSATVTPNLMSISCGDSPTVIATGSPTQNVTHFIYPPFGGTFAVNSGTAFYAPVGIGTYTHVFKNNINGCSTSTLFSVSSSMGFPTFSVTSAQNFSLGCSPTTSIISINIINSSTSPPGGPLSYTVMGPGSSGIIPSGILGNTTTYTFNAPGTYTFVVRDNTSMCTAIIPLTIFPNRGQPKIIIPLQQQTLTCVSPNTQLQGSTSFTNVSYLWLSPIPPFSSSGNSITVSTNSASPGNSVVGVFTLNVTNNGTGCSSTNTVTIYQNIYPPNALIFSGNQFTLTCTSPTIVLTNVSTTGIPPGSAFSSTLPIVGKYWYSPLLDTLSPGNTYIANAGGTYTMMALDPANGCTASAFITIVDTRLPEVQPPAQPFVLCGNTLVSIYPIYPSPLPFYTYSWTSPPGAVVIGANTGTLSTNTQGVYYLTITDAFACSKIVMVKVGGCVGLTKHTPEHTFLKVSPNPGTGLFNISMDQTIGSEMELTVINMLGELILKRSVTAPHLAFDLQNKAAGIYIISVSEKGKILATTKLIKQ